MSHSTEHFELLQLIDNPVAGRIVSEALDSVDAAYSYSGDAKTDPLASMYMPYHNGMHTRGVVFEAIRGCEAMEITGIDRIVTIASAALHDVVVDIGIDDGSNEAASLDYLHRRMRQESLYFDQDNFAVGQVAILGTCYYFEDGKLIQRVSKQHYPSEAAEAVAQVVAGADMAKLHTPIGPFLAHRLFQEKTLGASGKKPKIQDVVGFQQMQVGLLDDGYTYPNQTLHNLYATHTPEVAAYAEDTLQQIEAGNIINWDQLLSRDIAFMRQHA